MQYHTCTYKTRLALVVSVNTENTDNRKNLDTLKSVDKVTRNKTKKEV